MYFFLLFIPVVLKTLKKILMRENVHIYTYLHKKILYTPGSGSVSSNLN
jgi:hypothetical protein